jgi:hypothetical protein
MYKPKPLVELLKVGISSEAKAKVTPTGIFVDFSMLNDVPAVAESICKLIVASLEACVLAIVIDFIVLTLSPGAISSLLTPDEPDMLWYFVNGMFS